MSLFERDQHKHVDSPGDTQRDALSSTLSPVLSPVLSLPGSNSAAEESAAHIAEMVRRTTERLAAPSPSCAAPPDVTARQTPMPALPVAPPALPVAPPALPVAPPALPVALPTQPARPTIRQPSRRTLVAAGAVAAVLVGGAVALSHPVDTKAVPTSPTSGGSAPVGYAVKVTDVITDCASHARGRAKDSFGTQNCVKATRSLGTGQVSGRPALFVTSRVEMASSEAAASVKQVLDGNGTGNLNDLLREGRTFPGAPDKMPTSGYASVQAAKVVTTAEAGFVDGGRSSNTDAALRAAAAQVAALVTAHG